MAVPLLAGYWDLNRETKELLLCARSRRMFGLGEGSPKRLSSYDWEPRIHPDDMSVIEGELESAERRNEIYAARFRIIRPDGSTCQIVGIGGATAKNPKRFVGLNFDLNEAAEAAEQASRSGRLLPTAASASPTNLGPANENDSRPWRSWLPGRATRLRSDRAKKDFERETLLRRARTVSLHRQLRSTFLNPAMLGEPAFDMLLRLYIETSDKALSARSLSSELGIPPSVAVRWLKALVDDEMVLMVGAGERHEPDMMSAALTAKGRIALDEYFKSIGSLG